MKKDKGINKSIYKIKLSKNKERSIDKILNRKTNLSTYPLSSNKGFSIFSKFEKFKREISKSKEHSKKEVNSIRSIIGIESIKRGKDRIKRGISQSKASFISLTSKIKRLVSSRKFIPVLIILICVFIVVYYLFILEDAESRVLSLMSERKYISVIEYIERYLASNKFEDLSISEKLKNNYPFFLEKHGLASFYVSIRKNPISKEAYIYYDKALNSFNVLLSNKFKDNLKSIDYFALGYICFFKRYYNEAYNFLKLAERLNFKDKMLDNLFSEHKKYITVLRYYEILANTSYKLKKYREAEKYFKKAIKLVEDTKKAAGANQISDTSHHFYLGLTYVEMKEFDKAVNEFEYVIGQEESRKVKRNNILELLYQKLGEIYYSEYVYNDNDKSDQAEKYLKLFIEKKIESPSAYYSLEEIADSYYKLGNIYEKKKNFEDAILSWKEALKYDANFDQAILKLFKHQNRIKKDKTQDTQDDNNKEN